MVVVSYHTATHHPKHLPLVIVVAARFSSVYSFSFSPSPLRQPSRHRLRLRLIS